MKKVYIWTFAALMLCYLILNLTLPTDPQSLEKYQLTQSGARLLNLSFVIPLFIVYASAFYGFLRFHDYAGSVKKSKESPALYNLAYGLMVLAFSLPIQSILGSLFSYVKYRHQDLVPFVTVFREYLALVLASVALYLIARGAQGLFDTLKKDKKVLLHPYYALLGPIVLASVYTWFLTAKVSSATGEPSHYLPEWMIILTLSIPYIFVWCVGIRAALQLRLYRDGVKGVIYKRAFDHLSKGIGVVVLISITIQFITTLSAALSRLSLAPLLLVVYFLVALYAVGYGFVARGAKKLKQIEEV